MAAIRGHGGTTAWIDAPADTAFAVTRRLVNSARAAGATTVQLSARERPGAAPLGAAPAYGLAGVCREGPWPVRGVAPLVTLSVQGNASRSWIVATARFLPVVERNGVAKPIDGLPTECLAIPPCAEVFASDAMAAEACRSPGSSALERVGLGGPDGCVVPQVASAQEALNWSTAIADRVRAWGLDENSLVTVMPEAVAHHGGVVAVVEGFRAAGAPDVSVGTRLLIQGNDGPPACDAVVRDAEGLRKAGARWLGGLRAAIAPR